MRCHQTQSNLFASFKEGGIRDGIIEERSKQVGTKSLGRLVGHLHSWTRQSTSHSIIPGKLNTS